MGVTLDVFRTETDAEWFDAGRTIFAAGDVGKEMYVILEGEVELRIGTTVIETLGPGEPFGEMALIDHSPRAATAVARTRCRVATVSEKRFDFMVQQTPHFARQVMRVMAARLRKMDKRLLPDHPIVSGAIAE